MKKIMIAIVSLVLMSGACWSDDMETSANEVKYYDNAKVVRIKSVDGEGFVQRSYDEGNEEATENLPLFENDTVGTTDGRMEIYLGSLNYLRLDADSVVVLEKIPQLRKTDLNVRIEQGNIYLDIENLDNEKSIEIQTPDCGIFLLDKGVYRINVGEGSRTEVYVVEGIAEVAGQESSSNVRENQKIVMSRGELEERPFYFYASEKDDFDNWNEKQNQELGYARYGTSRYLQSGYEDYEYEMSRSGRWSYMSDFNSYVWSPYDTQAGWMPYANGRWVWNPHYGYVWTSYDRCGWFTHHYGRWHWSYAQGWYWIPSYHWSPAWVSWFGDNDYYGWCPLSWWNRPIIIINNRWDHNYDYRHGIPHHSRSTIIIRKNELSAANINRIALNRNTLSQSSAHTIAYRGSAPSERPLLSKATVINARGEAKIYKQSGIVSTDKYRVSKSETGSNKEPVYKFNDSGSKIDPKRTYSKKSTGISASSTYFKSRSGSESSSSRARYSSSGSSSEKSSSRTIYRSKSGGSAKISTKSSSSSSSSSTSTTKAKKKKGEPSYLSKAGAEDSGSETAGSAPSMRYRSKYAASGSAAERSSYRSYEFKSKTASGPSGYVTGRTSYPSRFTLSGNSTSPFSSRSYNSSRVSTGSVGYSAPSYNYRYSTPSTSSSQGYSGRSSSSSYSSPARSQSSSSSSSFRSSPSSSSTHHATSSSSSQSSTATAKEKK